MKIEDITQMAKDRILESGEHMPMLYLQFKDDDGINILALPDILSSEDGKAERFFSTGRMIGLDNLDKEISQMAFVVEAWMARRAHNDPNFKLKPSEDPNRIEVLIVNTLDITEGPTDDKKDVEQGMHAIEMLRDGAGNLVDLLPLKSDGEVSSKLLLSFLAGFASSKMSDKQLHEQAIRTGLASGQSEEEARREASSIVNYIKTRRAGMMDVTDVVIDHNKKRRKH